MNKQSLRSFTSVLVCLAFLFVGLSGLILWLVPRGAAPWLTLGLAKGAWRQMHIDVSLMLLAAGLLHLVWNWGLFWGYLRNALRGIGGATPIVAAVLLLLVVAWSAALPGDDGHGRLEQMTVGALATTVGRTTDEVIAVFREEGIAVAAVENSLLDLAKQNRLAPPAILSVVERRWPQAMKPQRPH